MKRQNTDKHRSKIVAWIAIISIGFCLLVLFADYFDIPSELGLKIQRVNLDMLASLISTITTIALFVTAYTLIDHWETDKNKNKQKIAKKLLLITYKLCRRYLDPQQIKAMTSATKMLKTEERYEDIPFVNNEHIIQLAMDGIVTEEWFEDYIMVKNLFATYINVYQLYKDKDDKKMQETIDSIEQNLLFEIDSAVERLEGQTQ